MAGRGCNIRIEIIQRSLNENKREEISLTVALHSPLQVLKQQLETLTNIKTVDQVLILCDLSDLERNSDRLISHADDLTLRECGIYNDCLITLHAMGLQTLPNNSLNSLNLKKKEENELQKKKEDTKYVLNTPVTAAQANHSYNGIIFDIKSKCLEIDIISISIGGMLGRVRIFCRDRPWKESEANIPDSYYARRHYGSRESISRTGWSLVCDMPNLQASWDKHHEIILDRPIHLLPHSCHGIYIHSDLPDDLGIQYQSYGKDSIVAQDDHISIYPGMGHTSCEPFDEQHGWYRPWRGPCGSFTYTARHKGWTISTHRIFPIEVRNAAFAMLLCQLRLERMQEVDLKRKQNSRRSLSLGPSLSLPRFVIYYILEFMNWDWFDNLTFSPKKLTKVDSSVVNDQRELERGLEGGAPFRESMEGLLRNPYLLNVFHGAENVEEQQDIMQMLFNQIYGGRMHNHYFSGDDDDDQEEEDVVEEGQEEEGEGEEEEMEEEDEELEEEEGEELEDEEEWEDLEDDASSI